MTTITALDDHALIDLARRLTHDERRATAALLRVLMEADTRRLYLGEGCASMFAWCTEVLHLCEGSAYNRIEVARAARKFPIVLDLVERAEVTLTAARLLAPHLTADNHVEVLASARHKSKREVEAIVAALQPKPDAPTVVRRVPMTTGATSAPDITTRTPDRAGAAPSAPASAAAPVVSSVTPPTSVQQASPSPRALVQPLAPERYRIQVTVSRETHDRLRRAQSLLRHAVPTGDTAEILDRALVLLVEQLERRRFAETSRPKPPRPVATGSRHIPAAVRRDVWKRDDGRCAFAGRHGRCAETAFLEFHHVEPYANGGAATVENIELRCRAHNAHEARLFFGT